MSKEKKAKQLGMNPSTASGRLLRDLLFKFVTEAGCKCYRCGGVLTRGTFSIEHKEPWLDSEDPQGLFFDLSNIAFSHLSCNVKASRNNKKYHSEGERKAADAKRARDKWSSLSKEEQQKRRREKYLKYSC